MRASDCSSMGGEIVRYMCTNEAEVLTRPVVYLLKVSACVYSNETEKKMIQLIKI